MSHNEHDIAALQAAIKVIVAKNVVLRTEITVYSETIRTGNTVTSFSHSTTSTITNTIEKEVTTAAKSKDSGRQLQATQVGVIGDAKSKKAAADAKLKANMKELHS
jgi:acyl-CoA hydrolase